MDNKKILMKGRILVPHGVVSKLAITTGHARNTIISALAGKSQTDAAYLIRKRALEEFGGVRIK